MGWVPNVWHLQTQQGTRDGRTVSNQRLPIIHLLSTAESNFIKSYLKVNQPVTGEECLNGRVPICVFVCSTPLVILNHRQQTAWDQLSHSGVWSHVLQGWKQVTVQKKAHIIHCGWNLYSIRWVVNQQKMSPKLFWSLIFANHLLVPASPVWGFAVSYHCKWISIILRLLVRKKTWHLKLWWAFWSVNQETGRLIKIIVSRSPASVYPTSF